MFTHCDNNIVMSMLSRTAVLDPSEVLLAELRVTLTPEG